MLILKLISYRDGATPIKFGIRPLKSPGIPSYFKICLNFKDQNKSSKKNQNFE